MVIDNACRQLIGHIAAYCEYARSVVPQGSPSHAIMQQGSRGEVAIRGHGDESRSCPFSSSHDHMVPGPVVVVALMDDASTLASAAKELVRSRAEWIIISHAALHHAPHILRRQPDSTVVAAVDMEQGEEEHAWPAFLKTVSSALYVSVVGHGETKKGCDPIETTRGLLGMDVEDVARFLINHLAAKIERTRLVAFDFVACELTLPGEDFGMPSSFLGSFMRCLKKIETSSGLYPGGMIAATATRFNVGFPDADLDKRMEISIGMRTFTLNEQELKELGLAYQTTLTLKDGNMAQSTSKPATLTPLELALLKVYLETRNEWQAWQANDLPSRFKLFDLMSGLHLRVNKEDDVKLIERFTDKLFAFRGQPQQARAPGLVRRISIDHGIVGLSAGSTSPPFATYDLRRLLGHLALVLLKATSDDHAIRELDEEEQQLLRAYLLSPVQRVDTHIYRWIGEPTQPGEFIHRWRTRWPTRKEIGTAMDMPNSGVGPAGYIDGETLLALFALAEAPEVSGDKGMVDALLQAVAPKHDDVTAQRKAFYSEEGGVHPGENDVWYAHWPTLSDTKCVKIGNTADFTAALGRIGAHVSTVAGTQMHKVDGVRLKLLYRSYLLAGGAAITPTRVPIFQEIAKRVARSANAGKGSEEQPVPSKDQDMKVRSRMAGYWQAASPRVAHRRLCVPMSTFAERM